MIKDLNEIILLDNKYYKVTNNEVLFENANIKATHLKLHSKAHFGMHILPIRSDGRIGLVKEYRYGIDAWDLACVKGGAIQENTLLENINMELIEETGYKTENFSIMGKTHEMPSINGLDIYQVVAYECSMESAPNPEKTEAIEYTRFYTIDQIKDLIASGVVKDVATIALFYRYLIEFINKE